MFRFFIKIFLGVYVAISFVVIAVLWITGPPLKVVYEYLVSEGVVEYETFSRAVINKEEGKFSYIEIQFADGGVSKFELKMVDGQWEILGIEELDEEN